MPRQLRSIAFAASNADDAQAALKELSKKYKNVPAEEADVIVALGGDGFVLQMLHATMNSGKLVYGMNRGSVGFLMNEYATDDLIKRIEQAVENSIHPLRMEAEDERGEIRVEHAINEVALFRQSYQTAKLRVQVDGRERLAELMCDGLLLATPAGSTAYNFSAHGPILPLEAPLLALTPISAFRPRRWRGALLPDRVHVEIEVIEPKKRPVNAVADNKEVKSVRRVKVEQAKDHTAWLLSDPDHSWSDRILAEQFID